MNPENAIDPLLVDCTCSLCVGSGNEYPLSTQEWVHRFGPRAKSASHQLVGGSSQYLLGFNHPDWCRILSIHSVTESR